MALGSDTALWGALLTGKAPYVLVLSILLPLILATLLFRDKKRPAKDRGAKAAAATGGSKAQPGDGTEPSCLSEEPWCPKLVFRDWQKADEVPGCPWDFKGCETVEDALRRIWCKPLPSELESAFDAMKTRVRGLQVVRMSVAFPREEVRYAIVYTLLTGAELFGGEPVQSEAPVDFDPSADTGLRQRGVGTRGGGSTAASRDSGSFRLPETLAPFYEIHDGFGVLLSTRHLPLLLCNPDDGVDGSCFYVYPIRGFEPMKKHPHLFKFARVDRTCIACAYRREERLSVVYVESNGDQCEEDEAPLAFINDTVSNVAGQRVVPPSYMGGPGAFGVTACEGAFR